MNLLPALHVGLDVLPQSAYLEVGAAELVHGLVEGEDDHFQEAALVLGESANVGQILHEGSLGQSELALFFVLVAELQVDFQRPGLADFEGLGGPSEIGGVDNHTRDDVDVFIIFGKLIFDEFVELGHQGEMLLDIGEEDVPDDELSEFIHFLSGHVFQEVVFGFAEEFEGIGRVEVFKGLSKTRSTELSL
jgi:hypothetical protein